jgi:hypothetical protein
MNMKMILVKGLHWLPRPASIAGKGQSGVACGNGKMVMCRQVDNCASKQHSIVTG